MHYNGCTRFYLFVQRVKSKSLEDVVMLNVDMNTLETPFNDLSSLPSEVVSPRGFTPRFYPLSCFYYCVLPAFTGLK